MTQTEQQVVKELRGKLEKHTQRNGPMAMTVLYEEELSELEAFTLSVLRQGVAEGKAYIGKTKREWHQRGYREGVEAGKLEGMDDDYAAWRKEQQAERLAALKKSTKEILEQSTKPEQKG